MKVNVLQQFLRNLILPLESSAADAGAITALQRACQGFDPFQDKDVAEFAEFLTRAANYERDGKWPTINPPLSGPIVDEPNAQEYARRLRTFLEREAPANEPIPEHVRAELKQLAKRLKATQIKEMARELQVEETFRGAKQGIEKIVLRLTGQKLRGKKSRSARRAAAADPAEIQQYAAELKELSGDDGLESRVRELVGTLSGPKLKALAETLGATRKARRKPLWSEILLAALRQPAAESEETSSSDSKVERLAEIIAALKSKADGPDAPADEIEAELRSVEEQLDRDESIEVAKRIGVVRHLHSRTEAIEEIRRKVFETKRARESVAY
ncbi:MAG: hypothetical protein ACYC3I_17675 [Gemmataceae bacterium]